MKLTIQTKKLKDLSRKEMDIMNSGRIMNWGKSATNDWKKDFPLNSEALFVKENNKIVSFLVLRPIRITYLNKNYNILGLCSVISLKGGKGYGSVLVSSLLTHLRKNGKSAIGFTDETKFFAKAGLGVGKNLIERFVYVKKNGEKIYDNDGDGIYYDGKDKFISKVLRTKSMVEIPIIHW